jgi:heme exporter protein A
MLRVTGLACARGGLAVLEGVSFEVPAGGCLLLTGPNGSGKTTLLRTLAGLTPPLLGRIEGPEVAYASHADGAKAALTVWENLRFWAALHDQPLDEALLDAFDLRALRDRPAGTLSAGQSRRLGLARLAATRRPLLLMDEPTAALDARSAARFAEWLRGHLAAGGLAVVATHAPIGLEAPLLDLQPFRADPASGPDAVFL